MQRMLNGCQGYRMNRTMQGCLNSFQLGQVSNGFEVPAFAGTTSPPQPIHAIALESLQGNRIPIVPSGLLASAPTLFQHRVAEYAEALRDSLSIWG